MLGSVGFNREDREVWLEAKHVQILGHLVDAGSYYYLRGPGEFDSRPGFKRLDFFKAPLEDLEFDSRLGFSTL